MPLTTNDIVVPIEPKVRADRGYRYVVYESNLFNTDLHPVTGQPTAGLHTPVRRLNKARERKYNFVLNRAGQVTFKVPLNHLDGYAIYGQEIKRCIVLFVEDANGNPVPVWSGPIWNASADTGDNSISVTCVGWMELLNKAETRVPYNFVTMDPGVIATRLLAAANNRIANENIVSLSHPFNPGASAEDLLYGVGDCESMANLLVSGSHDTNYPRTTNAQAATGANSLMLQSTNKNANGFVQLSAPAPAGNAAVLTSSGGTMSPVDQSSAYKFKAKVWVRAVFGVSYTRTVVNWYGSLGNFISTTNGTALTSITSDFIDVNDTHNAPSNAFYAACYIEVFSAASGIMLCNWDSCYFSKTSVNVVPTPIQIGTVDSPAGPATDSQGRSALRTRQYPAGTKIGPAIQELSDIESGFDYEVATVARNVTSGSANGVTFDRLLNIKWTEVKAGTTIKGIGTDRTSVVFGHKWGPNNVKKVVEGRDGGRMADRVTVRGPSATAFAQDMTAIGQRGLIEDSLSVSDSGIADYVLLGYAGSEVAYRANPVVTWTLELFPWDGKPKSKIPRVHIDFGLGDICYLVAQDGAMQIGTVTPQPIRVFGFTVGLDDNGNERIESLQTTAS